MAKHCRRASIAFTAISCGQHLSCCVWQVDLSTELRKLTSTASLSFYRRWCSERHRTLLTSRLHGVSVAVAISLSWLIRISLYAGLTAIPRRIWVSRFPLTLPLVYTCSLTLRHHVLLRQEKGRRRRRGVEGKYIPWDVIDAEILRLDALSVANQC